MSRENRVAKHIATPTTEGPTSSAAAALGDGRPRAGRVFQRIEEAIVKHPGLAIVVGITAGVLLGCIVKRK